MKEYVEIKELRPSENVNNYIKDGWEIIETLKQKNYEMEELSYVVGYPAKKKIEDLKEIIKTYEDRGFKEQLFKSIAEENSEDYAEITESYYSQQNETTKFMNNYEEVLDNDKKYGLKEDLSSQVF
ncbi:hypothetical protein BAX60_21190 [Bacillus subtilis]|nr:hypothetical protein BAX60_21190 [Bacillus subtilis]